MIEQRFYQALSSATEVQVITGPRIYPLVIPEGSHLPAINYSIIGGAASPTQDTHGTVRLRVEISCEGATYGDAITLRNAVIQSIDGYNKQGLLIRYLMPHDFFDHEARSYRAVAEFYLYASV